MLLGIVYSFKRVFDPLIIEEERRKKDVSGEILMKAEQLLSHREQINSVFIDQAAE